MSFTRNTSNYFDYAAATPMSEAVLEAMQPYFSQNFYNPSALYIASQEIKDAIYSVRSEVASILGCKPTEVVFTAGGTEANNLAIQGVMQHFGGKNCIVSAVEHDSVLAPAGNYKHKIAPVDPDGRINLTELEKLIDDETVLVSVMYANNEIGTVQSLKEIGRVVKLKVESRKSRGIKLPIYLHTDAAQAPNYLPILVNSLGVDLMTLNGGKIYGPKQSGILYIKSGVFLTPQILGGRQERSWRSGTENVPAIVGFGAALKETTELREAETKRLEKLQQEFIGKITSVVQNVKVNGSTKHRLANNIHLTFPGQDNERLMMELDERGFMVATGSACSASSDEPSHVLGAIGLSDEEARSSIRITLGRQSTAKQLGELVQAIQQLVATDTDKG